MDHFDIKTDGGTFFIPDLAELIPARPHRTMKHPTNLLRLLLTARAMLCAFSLITIVRAQQTGRVTGKVSNSATSFFLEGARVQAADGKSVSTDHNGIYAITLPAGVSKLTVYYTGLTPHEITVDVPANGQLVRDVELTSSIYTMEKFNVSSGREGTALAITRQQQAPNVKNVVAADNFGNIANGNVGELLQQLPGISAIYLDGEVRSVMIRGIDPGLNTVSMDGLPRASVNSPGNGLARAYEFEQTSLGMIETIEVTKAPTPDMPASSIGGNINMVTKSAFDRKEKRTMTYSFGGVTRSKYRTRMDEWWREPIKNVAPLMSFSYADRYGADERLGVLLTFNANGRPGGSTSSFINQQAVVTEPAYIVNYQMPNVGGAHRTRVGLGGKFDYKLSERTVLTLSTSYDWYNEMNDTRAFLRATGNSAVNFRPGYTFEFQEVIPNAASSATISSNTFDISGRTISIAPSVRFRTPVWDIDYGFGYSNGMKWWEYVPGTEAPRHFSGSPKARITAQLAGGLGWTIDRSKSADWPTVVQTAGPDLFNLTNYNRAVSAFFDDKGVSDTMSSAQANVRRKFGETFLRTVRAGVFGQRQDRKSWNHGRRYDHIGRDGILNTADDNLGAFRETTGRYSDMNNGQPMPPWFDPFLVSENVFDAPTEWREDLAYRNTTYLTNRRRVSEKIMAAYAMSDLKFGPVGVLAGVRFEKTETDATGPLSTGTPPAVTGLKTVTSSYDDFFPGVHLKYAPNRHLVARANYSSSIGRPSFNSIIPLDTINDTTKIVTISNPGLRPQYSDNFDLSLEYYFEPVGLLSASVFRKFVEDFQFSDQSQVVGGGANNGFEGQYEGYRISTFSNGGNARYQGLELVYQQQFTFLPGYLRGLGLSLNYTYMQTEGNYGGATVSNVVAGFLPKTGNAALTYNFDRLSIRANAVWRGQYLFSNSANAASLLYEKEKIQIDLNLKYTYSSRLSFFVDILNLNGSPERARFTGFSHRLSNSNLTSAQIVAGIKGRR